MEVPYASSVVVTLAYPSVALTVHPSIHPSDRTVQYRSITGPRVNYNPSCWLTGFHNPIHSTRPPPQRMMWESLTRTAANSATKHPSRGTSDSDQDRASRMPRSVSINLCNNNFISHTDCRHRDRSIGAAIYRSK